VQGRLRLSSCDKDDTRQVKRKFVDRSRREYRQESLGEVSCAERVCVLSIASQHAEDKWNVASTSSSVPNNLSRLSNARTLGRCHIALSSQN